MQNEHGEIPKANEKTANEQHEASGAVIFPSWAMIRSTVLHDFRRSRLDKKALEGVSIAEKGHPQVASSRVLEAYTAEMNKIRNNPTTQVSCSNVAQKLFGIRLPSSFARRSAQVGRFWARSGVENLNTEQVSTEHGRPLSNIDNRFWTIRPELITVGPTVADLNSNLAHRLGKTRWAPASLSNLRSSSLRPWVVDDLAPCSPPATYKTCARASVHRASRKVSVPGRHADASSNPHQGATRAAFKRCSGAARAPLGRRSSSPKRRMRAARAPLPPRALPSRRRPGHTPWRAASDGTAIRSSTRNAGATEPASPLPSAPRKPNPSPQREMPPAFDTRSRAAKKLIEKWSSTA